jgi:hypothetical protein
MGSGPTDGGGGETEDYRALVRALTESLGGDSSANKLYFKWQNKVREGAADPDNRQIFKPRPGVKAKTAFPLGQFFGEHYGWCSGVVFLYASNNLDGFVGVFTGMARLGVAAEDLNDIACYVDDVVQRLHIDALLVDVSDPKSGTFGSICVEPDVDFDDWWSSYRRTIPSHYCPDDEAEETLLWALKNRHEARRRLKIAPSVRDASAVAYKEWSRMRPELIPEADEELQLAYVIARERTLDVARRRSGILRQIWDWLNERDQP